MAWRSHTEHDNRSFKKHGLHGRFFSLVEVAESDTDEAVARLIAGAHTLAQ